MKKNDIFTLLDELEHNDDTLKKWGDLYKTEEEKSVFSEATAESIKKECPDRVELEEIK